MSQKEKKFDITEDSLDFSTMNVDDLKFCYKEARAIFCMSLRRNRDDYALKMSKKMRQIVRMLQNHLSNEEIEKFLELTRKRITLN